VSLPNIPIPEIKGSEIVYKGYFDLRVDLLQLPHGPKRPYTVLLTGVHASAIIAETPDGKFVVNREYRHPTGKWLLSCPGGRIDIGESPLQAASRELLEETGCTGKEYIEIGTIFPFPAVTNQQIHYIWAKGVKKIQPPELETFELIHTEVLSKEEILQEISSGAPVDGVLCTALFLRGLLG